MFGDDEKLIVAQAKAEQARFVRLLLARVLPPMRQVSGRRNSWRG